MRACSACWSVPGLVLSAAVAAAASGAAAELKDCRPGTSPAHAAVRVIDGETFVIEGGSEVRLAGIMTPRASDAGAEGGKLPLESKARLALERLILGKPVELAREARGSDRYGRLLAQVFVHGGGAPPAWVQGYLLSHGLARVVGAPELPSCLEALLGQERTARQANAGLWADPIYQVRPAWRTAELLGLRGTYQIVEGRIVAAAERGRRIYLNFGRDWRQDFTAGLEAAANKLMARRGVDVRTLAGARVRVRGWIERRNGPYIEVEHPHQLERLEEAGASAAE
ncbi:MAG TPA: thermonuclease family protein [Hyphomicrobiaceae bacterium]|nr:thermonuclease family protein [Hyphomicrobiaceae bacterium]